MVVEIFFIAISCGALEATATGVIVLDTLSLTSLGHV